MNLPTKILYFDTNAIIKFFVREKGSELIKWIVSNRVLHSLSISTSQMAVYEFKKIIKNKGKEGSAITNKRMMGILTKSKHYFRECFHVLDYGRIPGFRDNKDTNYIELCGKYRLKYQRDAYHLACMINYLRCCGGVSRPRIITADKKFMQIIKKEGYDVIDPERTSIDEFISIISK